MAKVYTAQEMRQMADKLDNIENCYAICHYDGSDDEWRPLWMKPNSVVLALRQAADAMEREEKREKKYEYEVRYMFCGSECSSSRRVGNLSVAKLMLEVDYAIFNGAHIVRREVGEWEEVKE